MNTQSSSSKFRCNGEKLRQLRTQQNMTQEILAKRSNVDCRTIQRAEKNSFLQLETFADLAAALKVTVDDLVEGGIRSDLDTSENASSLEPKERNAVVLRHVVSGKTLLDVICDSFSGKVYCNAEPTAQNIDVLSAMVDKLEGLIPNPWVVPHEKPTFSLADRLRSAVVLSAQLEELGKEGIAVYAGTYTASAQIPRYDSDENGMYVSSGQIYRPVTVCRVFLDRAGLERVIVKVNDEWEEPKPSPSSSFAAPSLTSELDDELPF